MAITHKYSRKATELNNQRETRSGAYQYLILETTCSTEFLEYFSNEQSLQGPNGHDERKLLITDGYVKRIHYLAKKYLKPHQYEIFDLLVNKNKTQMEISKILNINQSSVSKSIIGNTSNQIGKRYGGFFHKLLKLMKQDPKSIELFKCSDDDSLPLPKWVLRDHKPNKKLDEKKVNEIRIAIKNGAKPTAIARQYGITYRNLRYIVTNSTWK